MTRELLSLIFRVASNILCEHYDLDIDLIPETGCNVFDNATITQKFCIISNSIIAMFRETERTMLQEASLAAILEELALQIQTEIEDVESGHMTGVRQETYYSWLSRNSEKEFRKEMRQWKKENPEADFTQELLFLKEKWNFKNIEFWRETVIEEFFDALGISDRDYQITSINPRMIEDGKKVKELIGVDDRYLDHSVPRYTEKDAKTLFAEFNLLRQEFVSARLRLEIET